MKPMMIDLRSQRGSLQIMDAATSVECGRQIRIRRSFRSLVEFMVPCCGFHPSDDSESSFSGDASSSKPLVNVTGTFFGYRRGRVSFCLQDNTRSTPLLLLEFAVPTSYLAKEMQYGLLRIALESRHSCQTKHGFSLCSLYNVPLWSMYCNGRKVGYAVKREMTVNDRRVLKLMQSVSVGAGALPKPDSESDDLMYLRASFQRVLGSVNSESFHMINPAGSSGQELSIFLFRS